MAKQSCSKMNKLYFPYMEWKGEYWETVARLPCLSFPKKRVCDTELNLVVWKVLWSVFIECFCRNAKWYIFWTAALSTQQRWEVFFSSRLGWGFVCVCVLSLTQVCCWLTDSSLSEFLEIWWRRKWQKSACINTQPTPLSPPLERKIMMTPLQYL